MSRDARIVILGGLLAILLVALLSQPSKAAKPAPLYAEFAGGTTHAYRNVEQQSDHYWNQDWACNDPEPGVVCNETVDPERDGVNDPVRCLWDVDDHTEVRWLGDYIRPGQSVSITKCIIADTGWLFGIDQEVGLGLTLTISFDLSTGRDFSLTSPDRFCVGGPEVRNESPLRVPIPDSNGGTGIPGTVTWTVTNDTDRIIRWQRVAPIGAGSGNLGFDTYDGRWCPEGWYLVGVEGHADGGGFDADGIGYWWDS